MSKTVELALGDAVAFFEPGDQACGSPVVAMVTAFRSPMSVDLLVFPATGPYTARGVFVSSDKQVGMVCIDQAPVRHSVKLVEPLDPNYTPPDPVETATPADAETRTTDDVPEPLEPL